MTYLDEFLQFHLLHHSWWLVEGIFPRWISGAEDCSSFPGISITIGGGWYGKRWGETYMPSRTLFYHLWRRNMPSLDAWRCNSLEACLDNIAGWHECWGPAAWYWWAIWSSNRRSGDGLPIVSRNQNPMCRLLAVISVSFIPHFGKKVQVLPLLAFSIPLQVQTDVFATNALLSAAEKVSSWKEVGQRATMIIPASDSP